MLSLRCFLLVAAFVAVESTPVAHGDSPKPMAGAARISIVPPFPTQMGGFNDRLKNFEGVHDDLFARALVLKSKSTTGETRLVFIGSDLMAVDAELVRLAREQITQATGIPASHILISCTHDHSAPSYYQKTELGQDDAEPSLKKFLAKQFATVAIEANRRMVGAQIGFGAGSLVGMTRNRQQKNNLVDPQVGVLRVEEREGRKTIATLFHFTGHPVVLGSANLQLSGEFPGAAARTVEQVLGGVAIPTQGACGDITVNRSGDPFLEIERLGRTLAGEVIKTSGQIKLERDLTLNAARTTIRLRARRWPTVEEAKKALKEGQADLDAARKRNAAPAAIGVLEDKLRVHKVALARAEKSPPAKPETELEAEIQAVRVGDVLFGAIPGELFVEFGLEARTRVKQDTGNAFCLVGYANGHLGYIVTPRGIATGGYEASVTRLDCQAGRVMIETLIELVNRIGVD